ncbi:alpha-ketoglutarate-dependent dioxygenase AlkB family protein [Chondromyces apiculatus]|uniref:Alkylated DNA repair protein AlkB n=1 Tax=Chondromyces apiculatus DSM 436 TaxID=1192034 RepID=A0A017TE37_9BACT|nr:alpha-ketoglutarate-dependent dioxygenase AlkB [Chondromyces apiculatus]EYF07509.1 Alkylated DNA repair protein AlkB [Chondromyces apiculatus DSM 436]
MVRVEHLAGGGLLTLHDPWLAAAEAEALFAALRDGIAWKQETIRVFGREHQQPRLTAWYGDPGTTYRYSGLTLEPLVWTPALSALRRQVEEASGAPFNSVLLNHYRGGNDAMGFHADAERELGENPVIASVSLGAPRRFVLKPVRALAGEAPVELSLGGGSLLVMGGTTQHFWRHGVPRQAGAGPRINLTFRRILPVAA